MPDLFDRLFIDSDEYESIAVHYFRAALGDYTAGETTKNQIVNAFDLDSTAQSDLTVICNKIDAFTSKDDKALFLLELHDVMMIAESGLKYQTKSAFKTRMGL